MIEFIKLIAEIEKTIIHFISSIIWFIGLLGVTSIIWHALTENNKKNKKAEDKPKDWIDGSYTVEKEKPYGQSRASNNEITRIKIKEYREKAEALTEQYIKQAESQSRKQDAWDEWEKAKWDEFWPDPEKPKPILWDKAFLMSIEWKLFEDICVEYLKIKGCKASVTNVGKDDGIDLKVRNSEGKLVYIGQCKAWSKPVDVKEIRELLGIMTAEKATDGFYITTSSFTQVAKEFAKGRRILLIDGNECLKRFNGLDEDSKKQLSKLVAANDYDIPTCASCNIKMVRRTSKHSSNKGNAFWGCRNYPRCRNTLRIRKAS